MALVHVVDIYLLLLKPLVFFDNVARLIILVILMGGFSARILLRFHIASRDIAPALHRLRLLLCYLLNLLLQGFNVAFLQIGRLFDAWLDQTFIIEIKRLAYLLNLLSIQLARLKVYFGVWVLFFKQLKEMCCFINRSLIWWLNENVIL